MWRRVAMREGREGNFDMVHSWARRGLGPGDDSRANVTVKVKVPTLSQRTRKKRFIADHGGQLWPPLSCDRARRHCATEEYAVMLAVFIQVMKKRYSAMKSNSLLMEELA